MYPAAPRYRSTLSCAAASTSSVKSTSAAAMSSWGHSTWDKRPYPIDDGLRKSGNTDPRNARPAETFGLRFETMVRRIQ